MANRLEQSNGHTNGTAKVGVTPRVKGLFNGLGFGGESTNLNTLFQALSGIDLPPIIRAQDPFDNHPWIFAASVSIATVASQAPFTIFRETEEAEDRKMRFFEKHYSRSWRSSRGHSRRAMQRYSAISSIKRAMQRALEPDFDHPVTNVLMNPNPYQKGNQLFWLTTLWLSLRGHCFWVLEGSGEDGEMVPGEDPVRIWPLSPDLFVPVLEHGQWGELIKWEFRPPNYMAKRSQGERVFLPLDSVIEFKQAHPKNFLQGVSRMAVTAYGVSQDLNLKEFNRSIVENDGDPGGVIMYDAQMQEEERRDWLQQWEQRHKGTHNKSRTALLDAGFKYVPIAMTPVELQGQEQLLWNRAEHLAVMGTPPSVLGVTEFVNYATDLGQKKNFWEHTIIPLLRLQEETLDASPIFFEQSDSVMGLFDLKGVEALRSGVVEKLEAAKSMCGPELHAPPQVAYDVVGLEVPEYDGSEDSLITPMLSTVDDILTGAAPVLPPGQEVPGIAPEEADDGGETEEGEDPVEDEEDESEEKSSQVAKAKGGNRWKAFIVVQESMEDLFGKRYRRWVSAEQKETLGRFDASVKARVEELETKGWDPVIKMPPVLDLTDILPDLVDSQNGLRTRMRPVYANMLDTTFNFTLDDLGGIPVFEVDAPGIFDVFQSRENNLVLNTPATVRQNLIKSLTQGISNGEDILALRQRIAEVYKIAASDAKTLQIARTETAGFMNETREAMFVEQGLTNLEWVTAGDEIVRETHILYGEAGPQKPGFNFLTLTNKAGTLTFPGDSRAPAGEVINCRCLKVPTR